MPTSIVRCATALLIGLLAACGSADDADTGTGPGPGGGEAGLMLSTKTTGAQPDGDGYTIMVDGATHGTIGANDEVTVTDVEPGDHTVELSQIQFNCATLGAFSRPVMLSANASVAVDYSVQCDDPARSRVSYSTDIVNGEIFVVNADGSDPQSLTDLVGAVRVPNPQQPINWSGDGSKMAFTRTDSALYVANADGTGVVQVASQGWAPIWQQDGRKLSFLNTTGSTCGLANLFVVEPGVSPPVQVTHEPCLFNHDYSASGGIVAFEYTANGLISTMHEDGSHLIPITDSGIKFLVQPSLSPDGSKVAYFAMSTDDEESARFSYDIFVSPTDNSSPPVNITREPGIDWSPAWSPDGTRIAYVNSPDVPFGNGSIYVVDVDGGHRTRVTPDDAARELAWSPDGTRVAYSGYVPEGAYHVFVANADGSGRVDITPNGSGMRPSWTGR